MAFVNDTSSARRWLALIILAVFAVGALTLAACAFDGTKKAKEVLSQYGTIEAEWQIRDEEAGKTYTYVILGTKAGTHETYEIIATDGRRETQREMAGGIDGTGCYLTAFGMQTRWISNLPPEALEDASKSDDETRTACLEYKETPGWQYVPAEDKKAAEPPPPPPKKPSPDAGTADGGADAGSEGSDADNVESALGL